MESQKESGYALLRHLRFTLSNDWGPLQVHAMVSISFSCCWVELPGEESEDKESMEGSGRGGETLIPGVFSDFPNSLRGFGFADRGSQWPNSTGPERQKRECGRRYPADPRLEAGRQRGKRD